MNLSQEYHVCKVLDIFNVPENFKIEWFNHNGKRYLLYTYNFEGKYKEYFISEEDIEYLKNECKLDNLIVNQAMNFLEIPKTYQDSSDIITKNEVLTQKIATLKKENTTLEENNANLRQTHKTRSEELDKIKKSILYRFLKFLRLI